MSGEIQVLIVDDDPDIRTIAGLSLELDPDFAVRSAGSHIEALALLEDAKWRPDAILLDVMMPEVDGLTLAARLRRLPGLATVPILFLTARARPADITRYLSIGAAGVITKPFDPLRLAGQVRGGIDPNRRKDLRAHS